MRERFGSAYGIQSTPHSSAGVARSTPALAFSPRLSFSHLCSGIWRTNWRTPLRSRKQPVQGRGGVLLEAGRDVGVAVPGDRYAAVSEQLAHDLDIDVRQQQEARRRMAQIVKADQR